MLYALDIETECAKGCLKKCDHALVPQTSKISCVGIYGESFGKKLTWVYRDLEALKKWLKDFPDAQFVGQNFKFDLHQLYDKGIDIPLDAWVHDTQLMAHAYTVKVSDVWLETYNQKRAELNKKYHKGHSHRVGSKHSLKTLAPFFLGVQPFWENPEDYDSDEYVLKDCEYTFRLCRFFQEELTRDNTLKFYLNKLMPWSKMLLEMERRGVTLDIPKMSELEEINSKRIAELKETLSVAWSGEIHIWKTERERELQLEYDRKAQVAIAKRKKQSIAEISEKYLKLFKKAVEKDPIEFNLDSPKQMVWLLRDRKGYDIHNLSEEETTGKEVLQRLAAEGKEDIQVYLQYRAEEKLKTSFFPSYREYAFDGVIHPSFNMTGTRTGRLSCNSPNLQQVKGSLHELFIARPGYKLVTRDLAAIEPRLVAYYAEDPLLYEIMSNERDFHSINAIIMCELKCKEDEVKTLYPLQRKLAKTCGLALMYGAGPTRIKQTAQQLGFAWTDATCRQIFYNFKEKYKTVFEFKEGLDRDATENPVPNLFGRKHSYPIHSDIYMKAFNTLIQSSASDLLLAGVFKAYNEFKRLEIDAWPLLLVHDEIVFEVPENLASECEHIIEESILGFELKTKNGVIPLKCEGKTDTRWIK